MAKVMKAKSTKSALARKIRQPGKRRHDLNPLGVLKCTEKVGRASLLIQERCGACHGKTIRDVLGAMVNGGGKYKLCDLRYDIKHGRFQVLNPGSSVGDKPAAKPRPDAPLKGKTLPQASLEEFFHFMQCQLKMETKEHTGLSLELTDKDASAMWPDVLAFATPNLGKTERWVPYHTIIGVHELFLVEHVHHNDKVNWNDKQRFFAMFIFRAHCKRDLFLKAELPLMMSKSFWNDPVKAFQPGGPMEKAILKYRRETGNPLITSCFRIIPERILKDDTENLVRSITKRTVQLLEVAQKAYPLVKDPKKSAAQKMTELSQMIQNGAGLGDTWAKMLSVCVDLAYPKMRLLESQCDVGVGALPPLRALLKNGGDKDKRQALKDFQKLANSSKQPASVSFWSTLKKTEAILRKRFSKLPLVLAQTNTKPGGLTAVTLQVQLCEYRQFRHSIARQKYGLPDDETMRCETERVTKLQPEDFIEVDKKSKVVKFEYPGESKKIQVEVPIKLVGDSWKVAERLAYMCFGRLRDGFSKTREDCLKFRDEVAGKFLGGEDAPDKSAAWTECRTNHWHKNPLCSFNYYGKDGKAFPFQTTQGAAAGSILDAERIARLCWEKLQKTKGDKSAALQYRTRLYQKVKNDVATMPAKKRRIT